MSTLWDAVKDRYDDQALAELTRQRDGTVGSVNDAMGERAVTAITSWAFPVYIQETYDSTEQGHIEVGVEGVVALLFKWGGSTHRIAEVRWDDWMEMARAYRNTHARARIVPESSTPASEQRSTPTTSPHTPWSDPKRFDGFRSRTLGPNDWGADV